MEDDTIKIEYKKLSNFLKDYVKSMSRGWLFLMVDKEFNVGETLNFYIQVVPCEISLNAVGKVVFAGENDAGEEGIGLDFSFDEESKKVLKEDLHKSILEKYGDVWGAKLCSLTENTNN